jgi:hypothetical protein
MSHGNIIGFLLGFGTTAQQTIEEHGVHYDCGCVLNENGDLLPFPGSASSLNVPGVYVAYFSTFGAMVNGLIHFGLN